MNHDDCNCARCEREAEAAARRRERNDDDDELAGRAAGPLAVRCDDCGATLRLYEGPLCAECEADRRSDADDACDDDGHEADA